MKNGKMEENQQKKTLYKPFSATLLVFTLVLLTLFSCSLASAWEFDNVKEFELGELEYGKITIYNAFNFPLIGSKLAEYTLIDNSDQCFINCYAEGTAKIYSVNRLFSDLNFYNKKGNLRSLKDNKILIQKNVSYEIKVNDHYEVCEYVEENKTDNCYQDILGTHTETRHKIVWVEYKGEDLEEGEYHWRVQARKQKGESIDWIGSALGEDFTEWAWWNYSWVYKMPINVSVSSDSTLKEHQVLMKFYNSSVGAGWNWTNECVGTNGSRGRVSNQSENAELDYWIKECSTTGQNMTVWIEIDQNITTSNYTIYWYYGNPTASSGSNGTNTFDFFDDFATGSIDWANLWASGSQADFGVTADNRLQITGVGAAFADQIYTQLNFSYNYSWYYEVNFSTIDATVYTGLFEDEAGDLRIGYYSDRNVFYTKTDDSTPSLNYNQTPTNLYSVELSNYDTNSWRFNITNMSGAPHLSTTITDVKVYNDLHFTALRFAAGDVAYFDNFRVRKYIDPEPLYYLGQEQMEFPTVILNSPADNINLTNQSIIFNCTAYDETDLVNVSLYLNGVLNETNSSGINNTDYLFPKTLGFANYNWTCQACDNLGQCTIPADRTLTVYKIFENSRTYNATSYETAQEVFELNISSTGSETVTANLYYDGTSYSTTKTGNNYEMFFTTTLDVSEGVANNTFYWQVHYGAEDINTDSNNQSILGIDFDYCTAGDVFVNFTFKNEEDASDLNATIDASTWDYWLGSGTVKKNLLYSNATENPNYEFCFSIENKTLNIDTSVQYASTGFPQRKWDNATTLTNTTTNISLYLLSSTDGIYTTFQVLSAADQPIKGVYATARRTINGNIILVGAGTTGDDGGVTFWVNPDYSHTFLFAKTGYDDVSLTITPTQSTYTVYMGGAEFNESYDFNRGISYSIAPELYELINDTYYVFNFTISSSYWDLTDYGFTLVGQNGTSLGSNSGSTGSGSSVTLNVSTLNYTWIRMDYYWNINGNYSNGSRTWGIEQDDYGYGFKTFFTHLKNYTEQGIFGLNEWSRTLIIFILIFIFIGSMSYASGLYSPATISVELFALVAFFDVATGLLPSPAGAVAHFPTIITGLVMIVLLIREALR